MEREKRLHSLKVNIDTKKSQLLNEVKLGQENLEEHKNPFELKQIKLKNSLLNPPPIESPLLRSPLTKKGYKRISLNELTVSQRFDDYSKKDLQVIISIMQIPPKYRREAEVTVLMRAFSSIKYFSELKSELDESSFVKLFQELKYEYISKRNPVFNIGDTGKKFYIVIKGEVLVLLKKSGLQRDSMSDRRNSIISKENIDDLDDDEKKEEAAINLLENLSPKNGLNFNHPDLKRIIKKNSNKIKLLSHGDFKSYLKGVEENDYLTFMYPNLFLAKHLGQGDSFGEVALRQNVSRTATIVTRNDCHFAILTRESFDRILSAYYNKLNSERLNFFLGLTLFQNWSHAAIEQLIFQMKLNNYINGAVLFKENQPPDSLYFIVSGEVEISILNELSELEVDESMKSIKNTKKQLNMLRIGLGNTKKKRIKLRLLMKGEMFGEDGILNNEKRTEKAKVVSSEAVIYQLTRDKFLAYVKSTATIKLLQEIVARRKTRAKNLIQSMIATNTAFKRESHHLRLNSLDVGLLTRVEKYKSTEGDSKSMIKSPLNWVSNTARKELNNLNEEANKSELSVKKYKNQQTPPKAEKLTSPSSMNKAVMAGRKAKSDLAQDSSFPKRNPDMGSTFNERLHSNREIPEEIVSIMAKMHKPLLIKNFEKSMTTLKFEPETRMFVSIHDDPFHSVLEKKIKTKLINNQTSFKFLPPRDTNFLPNSSTRMLKKLRHKKDPIGQYLLSSREQFYQKKKSLFDFGEEKQNILKIDVETLESQNTDRKTEPQNSVEGNGEESMLFTINGASLSPRNPKRRAACQMQKVMSARTALVFYIHNISSYTNMQQKEEGFPFHIHQEEDLINKFLTNVEEDIFSQNPLEIDVLMLDENKMEHFYQEYFVRENYIKMLIQLLKLVLSYNKENMIKMEDQVESIENLLAATKMDLQNQTESVQAYRELCGRHSDKNQKLQEALNESDKVVERLKYDLKRAKEDLSLLIEVREKYQELKNMQIPNIERLEYHKKENEVLVEKVNELKKIVSELKTDLNSSEKKCVSLLEKYGQVVDQKKDLEAKNSLFLKKIQDLSEELNQVIERNRLMAIEFENDKLALIQTYSSFKRKKSVEDYENLGLNLVDPPIYTETLETEQNSDQNKEEKNVRFATEGNEDSNAKEKSNFRDYKRNGSLFNEILQLRHHDNGDESFDETYSLSSKRPSNRFSLEGLNFLRIQEEVFNNDRGVGEILTVEQTKKSKRNPYETSQCVKLNSDIMDEVLEIDLKPFYNDVLEQNIPYHKWAKWLEEKLDELHKAKNDKSSKPSDRKTTSKNSATSTTNYKKK